MARSQSSVLEHDTMKLRLGTDVLFCWLVYMEGGTDAA